MKARQEYGFSPPPARGLPGHTVVGVIWVRKSIVSLDIQQERKQAHALLDLLPPAKLGAVRSVLEVMIDDDNDEMTAEDRTAIEAGLDSLDKNGGIPMEEVLADFGLTIADFESMAAAPEFPVTKRGG
jgi:hypothetical protein